MEFYAVTLKILFIILQGVLVLMTGVAADEELLQGAENGRYKVVAKAEPYKNLPVSFLFMFR